MKPLDNWMILEKEEAKRDTNILLPESVRDKSVVEIGDIFIPTKLGPDVGDRIKVGDRCLFYGMATIMGLKLPSGKSVWVGRSSDVAFILEEGE